MPIVLKSGSLNLLEPTGPFQACNGLLYLYLLVAWTTREEVFIRNSSLTQSRTIPGPQQVPLRVLKYDPVRIRIALLLRDCRLLTDCCVWWLKSYQGRCQVSGSERWPCHSIARSRHCVWFPWSHFTVRSGICVCVRVRVRARARAKRQQNGRRRSKWND